MQSSLAYPMNERKTPMTTHTQTNHSKANSNHAGAVHAMTAMLDDLDVKHELNRAKKAATKFTDQAIEAGQAHPKTAAAVLLGAGALLGSIAYSLFAPRPTATQLLTENLQRGAMTAGRSFLSGLAMARKRLA
jgi:hypothetical protein